jgi:hypothetical protein
MLLNNDTSEPIKQAGRPGRPRCSQTRCECFDEIRTLMRDRTNGLQTWRRPTQQTSLQDWFHWKLFAHTSWLIFSAFYRNELGNWIASGSLSEFGFAASNSAKYFILFNCVSSVIPCDALTHVPVEHISQGGAVRGTTEGGGVAPGPRTDSQSPISTGFIMWHGNWTKLPSRTELGVIMNHFLLEYKGWMLIIKPFCHTPNLTFMRWHHYHKRDTDDRIVAVWPVHSVWRKCKYQIW